ncbi:unnamed protein product, partial [Rotaria magnacalcarata]
MSIIRAVQYEQLLNILRLQYPREKLNNQKWLMLVPILYPAPAVFLSNSIHVKCQALARGHVLKWLPEFFQTISNT